MDKKKFVEEFQKTLESNGDMFFSSGSLFDDFEHITGIIQYQGYWSGNGLRYFFDADFNFIGTEERRFGQ